MSSYFSVKFLLFNLHFGFWHAYNPYLPMNWEKTCNTCSQKMVKYSHTLNSLLQMIFSPSVVIIRLVLYFHEPRLSYRSSQNQNFPLSVVQYFWSLASKVFLCIVMATCLLLYDSILLNLSPTQSMAVGHSVPFYSAATVPILTLSALKANQQRLL